MKSLTFSFLFNIVFDSKGIITHHGPSLVKIAPEIEVGGEICNYIRVVRPQCESSYEAIIKHKEELFLLETLKGTVLRGQFLELDEHLGFFGSPWFTSMDVVSHLGLTFQDFALHDPIVDYILLLQTISTALSDSRQLAEKLELARNESEKANQAKTQFLATMSHEIRTPLNVILGFTDLISETPLSIEQQRYLKLIQGNSELLRTLISDILDVSKIEAGQLELESTLFDLGDLIEEVARKLRSSCIRKRSRDRYVS